MVDLLGNIILALTMWMKLLVEFSIEHLSERTSSGQSEGTEEGASKYYLAGCYNFTVNRDSFYSSKYIGTRRSNYIAV